MNQRGNIVLWIGIIVIGAILAVGIGIGVKYYQEKYIAIPEDKLDLKVDVTTTAVSKKFQNTIAKTEPLNQSLIEAVPLKGTDSAILNSLGWRWNKENDEVFYKDSAVAGADAETLVIFPKSGYAKDDARVYSGSSVLAGADTNSFTVVNDGYYTAKDKNQVYYGGSILKGVEDPATFEKTSYGYKDKNGVYYTDPYSPNLFHKIEGADPLTFVEIDKGFFKDKNNVYYDNAYEIIKIEGVDSATFKLYVSDCRIRGCAYYFKDKQKVFYGGYGYFTVLNEADPLTFEYVGGSYSNNPEQFTWGDAAKDKDCIYHGTKKILDANGFCVNPTKCTKDTLETNCN